ncbi:four-carbon acid sugar kinase family protein [Synechococcales cyanobacterium C]|uniref:Four-carbon acid sugar kinase family protein n=1 Tax=Petrachloros mirabilis ULC683 TaxID=2781853 RepID=A0A8K1ZYG4_9CYAN|nr:four-carbon acid sugar kinase family protein [Petrachloros mirabilis]NCJ06167.1 four-carbon acid sugar kinase family protein [Petrachloros mirabilis ULC683]
MESQPKIIVLDDDPTGSQTVHSCLLLTRWDVDTLVLGLQDQSPIFFVLTNTRSLPPAEAESRTREVCQNLKQALAQVGVSEFLVVSRSDSTLRGHYPIETDAITAELGPFDAHFLVPAFFEGGRFTRDSIHYLVIEGEPTPVHKTEFAQDSVFGYHHSYLPDYVAEKTAGQIGADQVERFVLADVRGGCLERLLGLQENCCGVVDAETQADLDHFAQDVLSAASQGKRFLFRSAASLLTALAKLPPQPVAATEMGQYVRQGQLGAFLVGSHVQKTTTQLEPLLTAEGTAGIEVVLAELVTQPEVYGALRDQVLAQVYQVYEAGKTPVIYTSRQELTFADTETRLQFGLTVSALLMEIVQGLPPTLGYLVSKGGITSNDVLSTGLNLRAARLLGQILPGCSVVRTPRNHPRFPDLPVVLFPGNVGDREALVMTYRRLSALH